MKKSDFYYDLPEELIAQTPLLQRDHSRLMTLNRESGEVGHEHFYDIIDHLVPGDCLVINDTRVLPARLYGQKTGGGSIPDGLRLLLGVGKAEALLRLLQKLFQSGRGRVDAVGEAAQPLAAL